MSEAMDKLTTEELQAELEKRQLGEMSKEQLIEELKKAKAAGSRPEDLHQSLIGLADQLGVDVKAFLKFGKFEFYLGLGLSIVLGVVCMVMGLNLIIEGLNHRYGGLDVDQTVFGTMFLLVGALTASYAPYSTWRTYRKIFDSGRHTI